ncbi:hypothetical protein BD413DRAFT_251180 [Trametes elegans]|nr:hypothetical protein BD413DRAFT_251180 [Trametes elegans]
MDPRLPRPCGLLTPAIVLGYLYALSTRYNRRLTEYSSYSFWTTILFDLAETGTEGPGMHLAVSPQAEVFESSTDNEPSDSSKSELTRPEGNARTAYVDLAIISHGLTINWSAGHLANVAMASLKAVWDRITSPREVAYDPKLLKTIRMVSSYVVFVELKRPVSRHIPIPRWIRQLKKVLNKAQYQAEDQFDIAMHSDRYVGKQGVWLIAGSADAFCLRWARYRPRIDVGLVPSPTQGTARASRPDRQQKKQIILTREESNARSIRAARRRAGAAQPKSTINRLLSLTPPFSDQDIADYFALVPAEQEMLSFAPVPPQDLKKEQISDWTSPIRVGSLAAARYLDIVRTDIRATAANAKKKRENNRVCSSLFRAPHLGDNAFAGAAQSQYANLGCSA